MSFRIIDWNYAFDPSIQLTASSEDPSFPASNLSSHFRSKVWRSYGYFVIDSTNQSLDFNEGGGELNATITTGSYTVSELETEIKTQLDATGGDTYTVSHSRTTGKWTITSDGSTLSLLWNSGSNTATSIGDTLGFDTASDDSGALTYTGVQVAIHTEEYVQFDLITWSTSVDSFVALFDKIAGSNLTNSAVVKLQAHQTTDFSTPSVNQTLTFSDAYDSFQHFFSSAQTYRFWRLNIVDPQNPDLYVEIPLIVLGYSNQNITQAPEIGFKESVEDMSSEQESVYGDRYFDIRPHVDSVEYSWSSLADSEKAELRAIYERVGKITPITVVIDDQEAVFANVEEHIHYGRIVGGVQFAQSFSTYFDTGIKLLEAI